MRAIILSGGKGTRLRPFTSFIPKPLVPLGDKYTILEIIIKQLANNGFTHITLAVNHMSHLIQSFFGDGSRYSVKIDYSVEDKELSTIGPLKLITDLPENFLVMNGDVLTDLDYKSFFKDHRSSGALISVSTFSRTQKIDFGVIEKDDNNNLNGFVEKPEKKFEVSMGVYMLSKQILDLVPDNQSYGFDTLMHDLILKGMQKQAIIKSFKGFWLDIGRPDDYDFANENYHSLIAKLGFIDR